MGVGVWYTIKTHHLSWYSWALGCVAMLLFFLLALFDSGEWTGCAAGTVRDAFAALGALCLCAYGLMSVDSYPYGPLCFFLVGVWAALAGTHSLLSSLPCTPDAVPFDVFVMTLTKPFYFFAVVVGGLWFYWASLDVNAWAPYRKRVGQRLSNNDLTCREKHEKNWMDDEDIKALKEYETCEEIFLLWVSPFVAGMCLGVFGFLCHALKHADTSGKKMVCVLGTLAAGAWCAASLAGAGHGVTTAIFMFLVAGVLALVFAALYSYGVAGITQLLYAPDGAAQAAFAKFVTPYMDIWKGFLTARVLRAPGGPIEGCLGCCVTDEARSHLHTLANWNWTPVFDWAVLWGVGLVALTVIISKFTVLAMSVVVSAFGDSSVLVATLVLTAVGLFLFILPPVPGAPIYLAAGFMLLAVAKKNGWTVLPAICYTCVVSLIIKLIACTLQQKMIGENLAGNLWIPGQHKRAKFPTSKAPISAMFHSWIRKTCGVNSEIVRMTRLILMEPGLSIAKVTILVGGPDWPTSVLCGILKVDLLQVMIGTSPIMALIIPTVMAGAFLSIDESYAEVLSVIFASAAATVQSGAIVVAAIYLDREMERRKDELAAVPYDEEVRASRRSRTGATRASSSG
ncbi:hypothetical protein JL720_3793 [Aureococcus anophagefferens]|nr:hypothetical protein JL720_3793 [Aureococcus anophagefferens]